MTAQDPFAQTPSALEPPQGTQVAGGTVVDFLKILEEMGKAGAKGAERTLPKTLPEGVPSRSSVEALKKQGRKPGIPIIKPQAQEGTNVQAFPKFPRKRAIERKAMQAFDEKHAKIDQLTKEMAFQVQDKGKPSEDMLRRIEEAITSLSGADKAIKKVQELRDKFGVQAPMDPGIIHELRKARQIAADVADQRAAERMGFQQGLPENVVNPNVLERARIKKNTENQLGEMGDIINSGLERMAAEADANRQAVIKARSEAAGKFLEDLKKPSASPERVRETGLRRELETAGISRIDADAMPGGTVVEGFQVRNGPVTHMHTDPETGQAVLSTRVLAVNQGFESVVQVQIPFPSRVKALEWMKKNLTKEELPKAQSVERTIHENELFLGHGANEILHRTD